MRSDDPVASMIPWYAAGTLSAEERAVVEGHLTGCAACRELLERSVSDARLYEAAASADGHVHPRLLVEYAESPAALDPETRAGIEARLSRCETCREALERLRETASAIEDDARRPSSHRSLWELLSATVLRPAPAFAYLLALVLLGPFVYERFAGTGTPPVAPLSSPRVLLAPGDRALRGEETQALPLRIDGMDPVLLLLRTDLSPADVADAGTAFEVELSSDGTALSKRARAGRDFLIEGGRVTLPVLVDPRALAPGSTYVLGIRVMRPGDPMNGRMLYRTRIVPGERP